MMKDGQTYFQNNTLKKHISELDNFLILCMTGLRVVR